MNLKMLLKQARDNYIANQVESINIPAFNSNKTARQLVVFTGKVQNVGFRYEVYLLANKLGLTGWVRNRENGEVEAELQGEIDRIEFLISFMKSLKRAKVKAIAYEDKEIIQNDNLFEVIK